MYQIQTKLHQSASFKQDIHDIQNSFLKSTWKRFIVSVLLFCVNNSAVFMY